MIEFLRKSKAHLFIEELKDEISVDGESHHHLTRVMRLNSGDLVSVACTGIVREYVISDITRDEIKAAFTGKEEKIIEPKIELIVSLFKLDRLEWGISKAIEAGATSIVIGSTTRSSIKIEKTKQEKISKRIEAVALSAAMQSRRSNIVPVSFVGNLVDHCKGIENPIVVCEPNGSTEVPSTPISIVIGPEGGFSAEELTEFENFSDQWTISPYILRAETAMAVVPALLNISASDTK